MESDLKFSEHSCIFNKGMHTIREVRWRFVFDVSLNLLMLSCDFTIPWDVRLLLRVSTWMISFASTRLLGTIIPLAVCTVSVPQLISAHEPSTPRKALVDEA